MAGDSDYTVRQLDEMEVACEGSFRRVRAELGVQSFGMQVLELPPDSDLGYPEHEHSADGQEEVYLGGSLARLAPAREERGRPMVRIAHSRSDGIATVGV